MFLLSSDEVFSQRRAVHAAALTAQFDIGRTSKHGGALLRTYLFEAAGIILHRVAKWSTLKACGTRLAKRISSKKATVGVARNLAGILHRMWKDGREFR